MLALLVRSAWLDRRPLGRVFFPPLTGSRPTIPSYLNLSPDFLSLRAIFYDVSYEHVGYPSLSEADGEKYVSLDQTKDSSMHQEKQKSEDSSPVVGLTNLLKRWWN
jgi:hypothetical protein